MRLEDKIDIINLYDIYYELFTKKQQEIFEMYYDDDYSVTEIANTLNISLAAVSKTLKQVNLKLNKLENSLKINQNYNYNKNLLKDNDIDLDIIKKIK